MKIINTCLIAFLILLLGVGFVSAADDGLINDANATVLNVANDDFTADGTENVLSSADDSAVDGDEEVLSSADEEVIGASSTHVKVNSYNMSSLNPHSVDINDDSDYVAYVYAPKESQGNVSVIIGEDADAREIFNKDIQSLYREDDLNAPGYAYFYIKPTDIEYPIEPDVYYTNVIYKYGLTLSERDYGLVRFVNDTRHVSVNVPDEIVIGNPLNNSISIFVEGTFGNISVIIDNDKIIDASVFDLKLTEDEQDLNNFIHVNLDELSVGQHTYNISYYGGNWENVTFTGNFNVTYYFVVAVDTEELYYGDEVNFIVTLPNDASSNEIRVNNKTYIMDLENGFANFTFSDFNLGENTLNFTYNDEKYGEKSFQLEFDVVPAINVTPDIPDEFSQDGEGNITLELPQGFAGFVSVYVNDELVSSTEVSGGNVTLLVSGLKTENNDVSVVLTDNEGHSYEINKTVYVPKTKPQMNIIVPTDSTVPEFTIDLPSDATGTFLIKIENQSLVKVMEKGSLVVTVPGLADGIYNVSILYTGDDKYEAFIENVQLTIKTVVLKDLKLTVTVPSIYYGKNAVVTVKTDSLFTGNVNVKINSKTYVINVVNGKGTKSVSGLKAGAYTAVATFAGNNAFKSSTKSVKFNVKNTVKLTLKKVKIKKSAKKLVIKATLKINGKAVKGKTLKFKFKGKTYKAKTSKKGVAKITIKKKILKKLKVGKKVKYQVTYSSKTVKKTVKVKR